MPSSEIRTFTDPDGYFAALPVPYAKGVATRPGSFRAELTKIDLHRVLVHRGEDNLPRVVSVTTSPLRASFFFATSTNQPNMYLNAMELSHSEIMAWDLGGEVRQHRAYAACQWGAVALAQEDLITVGHAFIGRELTPPSSPGKATPFRIILIGTSIRANTRKIHSSDRESDAIVPAQKWVRLRYSALCRRPFHQS